MGMLASVACTLCVPKDPLPVSSIVERGAEAAIDQVGYRWILERSDRK